MTEIVTAAQMRALENAAMESGRVTGSALMARAGEGVISAALEAWPELAHARGRALILCGPGNNGGDGYVIARGLARRGWNVRVCATGQPKAGDAASAAADWIAAGGKILAMDDLADAFTALTDGAGAAPVLIVDALLGIGQSRNSAEMLAPYWQAVDVAKAADRPLRRVSVDLPTGYDCDTGHRLNPRPFDADLVVTFHARKPVHKVLEEQRVRIVVVPIGL